MKSPEQLQWENAEAELEEVSELIQLTIQAALLTAGFHTHKRQSNTKCRPQLNLRKQMKYCPI